MTVVFTANGKAARIEVAERRNIYAMASEVHRIICERCPGVADKTYMLAEICHRLLTAVSDDTELDLHELTA